jgi:iron complex outermembrane receptor protein
VKPLEAAAVAVVLICLPEAAHAKRFDVAAGRVGDVVIALAMQAGISAGVSDSELAGRRSPGVHGDMTVSEAFARALRSAGARAVFYEANTVRIVRVPPAVRAGPRSPRPGLAGMIDQAEIVVTASKQNMRLSTYPGSVQNLQLDPAWLATNGSKGSEALLDQLPALGSTHLGPGRNKLFIRGIADSSFSGRSQSTVGQYLDDIRLTYSAPDPNLNLYDMKQAEILVGPQGALYGAGSLGGVIRLMPNQPNSNETAASISAGAAFTNHGGLGGDAAAMINLPVLPGKVAARFVAYGNRDGGYIDDPGRGLRGINSVTGYGGRFALRFEDLGPWTIDLGVVSQKTMSNDGQYVLGGSTPLTRHNAFSQPFTDDYLLGYLKAERRIGNGRLVATSSNVRQSLLSVFDASGFDGSATTARYTEHINISLSANEIRFSSGKQSKSVVVGISAIVSSTEQKRTLGTVGAIPSPTMQVDGAEEASVFGQITHPLTRTLSVTLGQRATFVHTSATVGSAALTEHVTLYRHAVSATGSYGVDWHPDPTLSIFLQLQQGYRPGGLSLPTTSEGVPGERYKSDKLAMGELGLRIDNPAHSRVSLRGAVFYAEWDDIQADLIGRSGLPYTASVGNGRIAGFDGEIGWRPLPNLELTAAAFVADSALTKPRAQFATSVFQPLPNVPLNGARLGTSWHRALGDNRDVHVTTTARYVGRSLLGVGSALDIRQGDYTEIDAGARLHLDRVDLSIDIDNIGNNRGNIFSFGNPFGVLARNQETPLRPRTIRVGLSARW